MSDTRNNIPLVTNLVAAGDPAMKAKAHLNEQAPTHLDDLNQRIDDIETAIGQDNSGPVGRAHAIRVEDN
jgi:hypothetical protein